MAMDSRINVRATSQDKQLLERAARLSGREISDWARNVLIREAQRELKAQSQDLPCASPGCGHPREQHTRAVRKRGMCLSCPKDSLDSFHVFVMPDPE